MKRLRYLLAIASIMALVLTGFTSRVSAADTPPDKATPDKPAPAVDFSCGSPRSEAAGEARCFAQVRTDVGGQLDMIDATPSGYGPADLRSAYKLTSNGSSSQTVAIVDAYNDPNAEADLGVYRAQYGLPACTTANGCFRKVNQNGGTTLPARQRRLGAGDLARPRYGQRDLPQLPYPAGRGQQSTASPTWRRRWTGRRAWAPKRSATATAAASTAAKTSDQSHYNHPGIAITVSSGDSGYGVEFPAASQYVTAVGGTHLVRVQHEPRAGPRRSGTARAAAAALHHQAELAARHRLRRRTVADVSAVADPNTGVAVIQLHLRRSRLARLRRHQRRRRRSSPASMRWPGTQGSITYGSYPYSHTGSLFDVTSGSNGSCGGSYLCTGKVGL